MFASRLSYVQARQADFTDAFMKDLNIADSDLSGSIFKRGYMLRAVMIGSNLSDADLQNADLTGSALEKGNFTGANLSGALLKEVTLVFLKTAQSITSFFRIGVDQQLEWLEKSALRGELRGLKPLASCRGV